jgi:sortase (surface protein transpeptidase)
VAGHRTTYSKPFADLDQLVAGDQVIFTTPEGTFTYEVRGVIIVPESHIGIAAQSDAHTATLFACHPKGSATHRIVAKLRLLNPDGTPADPDAKLPPVEQGTDPTTDTTLHVRDASTPALPGTDS